MFGSRRGGGFVLDAVLVVGRSLTYGREDVADLPVPQHVRDIALHPLYSDQDRHLRFTLHEGRTAAEGAWPVQLRPRRCPPTDRDGRFARPAACGCPTANLVNDNLAMAVRVRQRSAEEIAQVCGRAPATSCSTPASCWAPTSRCPPCRPRPRADVRAVPAAE